MREIEFRGKYDLSSEFTYGDLIHGVGTKSNKMYILPNVINLAKVKNCHPLDGVSVLPETIGQYTGLKDKNGTKIFEGDIIGREGFFNRVIVYHKNGFYTYSINNPERFSNLTLDEYDFVIGNIHDNPELLK